METLKKLPIGIQDFETLRQGDYVYVDKTRAIHRLITEGVSWFVSRPRRFGKSLLISTLAAIFQGRRDLFDRLWIAGSDYGWPAHPVIHLDMSRLNFDTLDEFESELVRQLAEVASGHGLEPGRFDNAPDRATPMLADLIGRLAEKKGKAVVLVDEYDKPILDNMADVPKAIGIRDQLRDFYTILESRNENLRFVLLTGVTRFSMVSVFSGLNYLNDITYDREYGSILGITQSELESVFAGHLEIIAQQETIERSELLGQVRDWYGGYRFHPASESVYNPISCLTYLEKREFGSWWFETGSPTLVVELIRKSAFPVPDLEGKPIHGSAFFSFEVDRLDPLPLLQQTGYLTITGHDPEAGLYTLDYPNREVREAFLTHLAETFSGHGCGDVIVDIWRLQKSLTVGDLDGFFQILTDVCACVPCDAGFPAPHHATTGNASLSQEKITEGIYRAQHYRSLFYLVFRLMGLHVGAEVRAALGRIGATVELDPGVWIFEFQLDGGAEAALARIKEKDYAGPYRAAGKPVHLVGVNFNLEKRIIGDWQMETLAFSKTANDRMMGSRLWRGNRLYPVGWKTIVDRVLGRKS
ncbi:MAG: PD-(D/E)XK nuclease superfamily protein [Candidatus Kentron sp. G]|nr:MAG: PD-(D/E)XK nuclease superfamily protein [Candidatus Kentron sp. G]VFN01075.1 MAG: PD-(D/E)XK nuclease superfamily protein [Candidatus Kentron sp. G]VFN03915.1 MAG: PD-(D/E)XK nuclease superfamily protein [Candidatus Kentron sp. G]